MQCVLLQDFFITCRENTNVILTKRQRYERRNFRKIAIFNHKFNNYDAWKIFLKLDVMTTIA
jgi:hypothetical protein